MGSAHGRTSPSVIDQLKAEPYRFDFFQAVRVLERSGHAAPVGHDGPAEAEVASFIAPMSMSFPSAAISTLTQRAGEGPASMAVNFFGLTGPSGVMPRHYSSLLLERTRDKETGYRDFLDLFNHRLVSLFYRAWEKYRFPVSYERAAGKGDPIANAELFTLALYALSGMGTGDLRGRTAVPDETFIYFGGLFAHQGRPAAGVGNLVRGYFEVQTTVEQFIGQWLPLAKSERTAMPSPANPKGQNCRLGVNTIMGTRVWDVQSKFRLRLGPLTYSQFCSFMPSGRGYREIFDLIRTYVGPCLDFDIQPVLLAAEVPPTQLRSDAAVKPRLGQNVWMMTRSFEHDFDGAVFAAPDAA